MIGRYFIKIIFIFGFVIISNNCVKQDSSLTTKSKDYAYAQTGDIVVTNYNSDSAMLLDAEGNFKSVIYNVTNNSTDQIMGVAWDSVKKKIVLSISGSTDRVVSISPLDGSSSEVIVNTQFNGTPWGLTVDTSGNYLLIETSAIEKFDSNYQRVSDATFPVSLAMINPIQIGNVPSLGFVVCSAQSDVVSTFDNSFNVINSKTSTITDTNDAYGCGSDDEGNIYVSWYGTTSTIAKYNTDFSSELLTYSDISVLRSPRGIAVKSNGNILVTDVHFHYIVELDSSFNFVRNLGAGYLNYPWHVLEIPSY